MAVKPSPVPRLRSSMMAGAVSAPARIKHSHALSRGFQRRLRHSANPVHQTQRVAWSTTTPGPMVEDSVMRFKYWPLEEAGFAFCRSAISA